MTVSVAYSADNDDFASDFDLDNDSEMEPTEDATLRPTTDGGCVFWWIARNSTQTELIFIKFINYIEHCH